MTRYSHLSNNHGGWNKRGGGAKVAKLLNVELRINVEAGLFLKIIKRGGGKTYLINVEGGTYYIQMWRGRLFRVYLRNILEAFLANRAILIIIGHLIIF